MCSEWKLVLKRQFFLRMCSRFFFLLNSSLYTDDATGSRSCRRFLLSWAEEKKHLKRRHAQGYKFNVLIKEKKYMPYTILIQEKVFSLISRAGSAFCPRTS